MPIVIRPAYRHGNPVGFALWTWNEYSQSYQPIGAVGSYAEKHREKEDLEAERLQEFIEGSAAFTSSTDCP